MASPTARATYYVSQQRGSDTNSGTSPSSPVATIGLFVNDPAAKTVAVDGLVVSSNICTVSCTGCNYATGWKVLISGSTDSYFNGIWVISEGGTDSFKFAVSKADGSYGGSSVTAKAPVLDQFDTVYVGPGTYRETLLCRASTTFVKAIQAASGTPPTSGGLVRSSNVVTVTAATPGDFASLSAGDRVIVYPIEGNTQSESFGGIFEVVTATANYFTYYQEGEDEISGGGYVYGQHRVIFDPDCRYLIGDTPGVCRLTRCDSNETPTSGKVINFNLATGWAFMGYDDAYGPQWYVDGAKDDYVVYGSLAYRPYQQMVRDAVISGYNGAYYCHIENCMVNPANYPINTVHCKQCIVTGVNIGANTMGYAAKAVSSFGYRHPLLQSITNNLYWMHSNIIFRSFQYGGGYITTGSAAASCSCYAMGTTYENGSAGYHYRCYRDGYTPAETNPYGEPSTQIGTCIFDKDLKPVDLSPVRNLSDYFLCARQETTSSSFDLSSESLNAISLGDFYPGGIAQCVAIRILSTDGNGSVVVELQKYVSGAWTTVRSKTRPASELTAGAWNDFVFDTGTGSRRITKHNSLWRIRITMTGAPGTGTTISSSSTSRTTAAYRLFVKSPEIPERDIDGRWRPALTYPDNWKTMIGPWEIPANELSSASGDYYSTAPGLKISSPGDMQYPLPVKGGVATTVTVYCKQVNCDSSRLPKLVVWGNGLGTSLSSTVTDTKTYDSNWEQLSVTFTCDQDGVVVVTARHTDYDSSSYSLWSDWAVTEA